MVEYLFILGRTSKLCLSELENILTRERIVFKLVFSSPEVFHILTPTPLDVQFLIYTLGGTIKIAKVEEAVGDTEIVDKLAPLIQSDTGVGSKITFGLSVYSDIQFNELINLSKEVKERLERGGFKVRFVLPKDGVILSSVVVSKQRLTEAILVREDNKIVLAKTLVVQDFEDWGKRDFGRPAADPGRGMLPPKVARMMVNLGTSTILDRKAKKTILDPFCGVGTILAEGMLVGREVIGSDQSREAIEKTRKNLEWLKTNYQLPTTNYQLLLCDATHISEKLAPSSIDAIVTEPYLGPVIGTENFKLKLENFKNIILGLEKLYLGCLKDWYKTLKPEGRIVIALPSFRVGEKEIFVKKGIDTRENLGYTLVAGPYRYSRPQAIVIRNIYILTKSKFKI